MATIDELILLATNPSLPSEDLALTMDVCDRVRERSNGPSLAAESLLKRIHHRNPHVAMLALAVLDACVKNCGYPFHLQIAQKRFLNELVRDFGAHPPAKLTEVQEKILELIQKWQAALCQKGRRDDLKNIADMYRLCKQRGYKFPFLKETDAVLIAGDNQLLTEEELEQQDQLALEVKLADLLKKGTPADLEQANELVKKMTGFSETGRRDYRRVVDDQLDKIDENCNELKYILDAMTPGQDLSDNRKFYEYYNRVKGAQPKIQQFIGEEADESRIARLLYLNDVINNLLESCQTKNKKIPSESSSPSPAAKPQSTAAAPAGGAPAETKRTISLIDLDFDDSAKTNGDSSSSASDSLSSESAIPLLPPPPATLGQTTTTTPTTALPGAIPTTTAAASVTTTTTAMPPRPAAQQSTAPQPQPLLLNLAADSHVSDAASQNLPAPGDSKYSEVFKKDGLSIFLRLEADLIQDTATLYLRMVNSLPAPMSNFNILLAAPKSMRIRLEPLSDTTILPLSSSSSSTGVQVTQIAHVENVSKAALRVKCKATYTYNGQPVVAEGEFQNIPNPLASGFTSTSSSASVGLL